MKYKLVPEQLWSKCLVCGMFLDDMRQSKNGRYKRDWFVTHLSSVHLMTIDEYVTKYHGNEKCQCGCGNNVKVSFKGKNLVFNECLFGHFRKTEKYLDSIYQTKFTRRGEGNPMFGKVAWNKGKTSETDSSMKLISDALKGKKVSDATRKNMSEAAKRRIIAGHTGYLHSEETKEKIRQNTLSQIKNGVFSQLRSKPHVLVSEILERIKLNYAEEEGRGPFAFDFYLIDYDLFIEVDGDYFHSNPKFYPNGPQTKTQKINWFRDIKKKEYSELNNITVLRFWEYDIINRITSVEQEIKHACRIN